MKKPGELLYLQKMVRRIKKVGGEKINQLVTE